MQNYLSVISQSRRRSFDPFSLNPSLWLDASDHSTLYDAISGGNLVGPSSPVALWLDKSGNDRNATQTTLTNRPTRSIAARNSRDVLNFGTSDGMNTTCFLARPYTLFFVCSQVAGNSRRVLNSLTVNAIISPARTSFPAYIGSTIRSSSWAASNEWTLTTIKDQIGDTKMFKNGNQLSNVLNSAFNFGVLSLGATPSRPESMFGSLAEVLIFSSSLSDSDRQAVESYMRVKWGIA